MSALISLHKGVISLLGAALLLSACDTADGPAEQMGESVDEVGDSLQDSAKDLGNAVEDACEDVSGENC